MSYPFAHIEASVQERWAREHTFRTPTDKTKPKFYVLDMFPYPSGAGLHVGHPEGYTATDIVTRYKRMRGFNVLHPMGWDAFGLPAERHAMQTGIHPAETTASNIANFKRQLQSLGFSYDWEREINTTDEKYYRWTQWIFLLIWDSWYDSASNRARPISELPIPKELQTADQKDKREEYINDHRLAYVAHIPVNWCAGLGTVLANEEVDEWIEKGYTVERRPMRQWMLRITAYAERLLNDLVHVDWPTGTLELQKNWIGRSEGAEVDFLLEIPGPAADKSAATKTKTAGSKGAKSVAAQTSAKGAAAKTGAKAKSATTTEPGQRLRIFTTRPDTLYGVTYMVLAPEHPAVAEITTAKQKKQVEAYVAAARLKSDLDRQVQGEKEQKTGVFTGGFAIHPLTGEKVPVWIADYVLMSYGTGAIMAVPAHDERDFAFAKTFELPIRYVVRPAKAKDDGWQKDGAFTGHGVNFESDLINDLPTPKAIAKMIDHLEKTGLGGRKVNYKLRDWLFSRQRYWGEPVPLSFDENGHHVPHPSDQLPLTLPASNDFQPSGSGESPLANLSDWVFHEQDGKKLRRETNTMPQWAGSCWYYLRYLSPHDDSRFVSKEEEQYWMGENGVDLYVGGAEHAVLHLLYARFWHKVLFDHGYVGSKEPFHKLIHQGLILGEDNRKMSKSLGNVVNPDDVVGEYGADAFRLYEMFMGPLEQMKPWASRGIEGVYRFLARVWRLYTDSGPGSDIAAESKAKDGHPPTIDPALLQEPDGNDQRARLRVLHQTIQKVTEDIERLSFNTAISQMMIYVNEVYAGKAIGKEAARSFLILLSPFAPHICETLWAGLGHADSIATAKWPDFDPQLAAEDEVEVVFQVNGKVRGKAMLPAGSADAVIEAAALADEGVKRSLEGRAPKRVIVVKGKLVNVVG